MMVSQIIIVLWLTITVGAITDLPSTFFNITDVPIRNTSCSAVAFNLASNLTFPFIGTIQYIEYRCYSVSIQSIAAGLYIRVHYIVEYSEIISATAEYAIVFNSQSYYQELARKYISAGFPELVTNSTIFQGIVVATFNLRVNSSTYWQYQFALVSHTECDNYYMIFLYDNITVPYQAVVGYGRLWESYTANINSNVFVSSAQQPAQSNIGIDGVIVLLFNNEGVTEAGTEFADLPDYFLDTTGSLVTGVGFVNLDNSRTILNIYIGGMRTFDIYVAIIFTVNDYERFTSIFQKSWKLQYNSVNLLNATERNSTLATRFELTIQKGFPEYNGADYIISVTQQLWTKEIGRATYQITYAHNTSTNENYVILSYGELTLAINASNEIILEQEIQQITPLLSQYPQHLLNLYSNIDQPGVYVFKTNATGHVITPTLECGSINCLNGGTCIGTVCICTVGYTGEYCQLSIVTQFNYTFLSPLRNIIQFDALTVGITPNDNISWSINNVKVSNTSEHMLLSILLNDTHQSYRYSLIINETLTTTTLVTFSSTVNNILNISSITLRAPQSPPTDVLVEILSPSSMVVHWQRPTESVSGYIVVYSGGIPIEVDDGDSLSVKLIGLIEGNVYNVAVMSYIDLPSEKTNPITIVLEYSETSNCKTTAVIIFLSVIVALLIIFIVIITAVLICFLIYRSGKFSTTFSFRVHRPIKFTNPALPGEEYELPELEDNN